MKLATLQLRNIQSHADSTFHLSPGINTFVGASNQGKSATLRGLLWAIDNRPAGDAILSDWARDEKGNILEPCFVEVVNDSGETLRRIKEKNRNGYDIGTAKLDAVRTSVPQGVKDFFRIEDVNVQRQLDPPYMLSISPGERARVFNSLIRLEEIDQCISGIEKVRRATASRIEPMEVEQAREETQLRDLAWVAEAEVRVAALEALETEAAALRTRVAALRGLLTEVVERVSTFSRFARVPEFETRLADLREACGIRSRFSQKCNGLSDILTNLRASERLAREFPIAVRFLGRVEALQALVRERAEVATRLDELGRLLRTVDAHATGARIPDPAPFEARAARIVKVQNAARNIATQIQVLKQITAAAVTAKAAWTSLNALLRDLESQLPTACPYCNGPLEKGTHAHG